MKYEIKKFDMSKLQRSSAGFPLEKLKVGECFEVEEKHRSSVYSAIRNRRGNDKLNGQEFSVRSIGNNKVACIRIK